MINWPKIYIESGFRLMPVLPRAKRPYGSKNPDSLTGYYAVFISKLEQWQIFIKEHPLSNTGWIWDGVQIDSDSLAAIVWAREHGVYRTDRAWILKTSRGYRLLYKAPNISLTPIIDSTHNLPDLLPPGRISVVPDSLHSSGHLYSWVRGHSPLDIPISELQQPPAPIVGYWQSRLQPTRYPLVDKLSPRWLSLVFEAIVNQLESTGHRLKPVGNGGFQTTCPFHADTEPSFSIHPERGWKCFAGCGEGRLTALAARLEVRVH